MTGQEHPLNMTQNRGLLLIYPKEYKIHLPNPTSWDGFSILHWVGPSVVCNPSMPMEFRFICLK